MPRNSSRKFGVGIIGYSIGRVHAHGWRGVTEYYHPSKVKAELIALCGRTGERLESEAARFGFKKTYTNWHSLVADKDVDIVDNCAPPYLHAEATIEAAERGKAVVCEKPMARNSHEAKNMLRAVEKAKVKNMVGYNYRFVPAIALAKQMVEEGTLGRLYYFKGSYLNTAMGYELPGSPADWHHFSKKSGYGALGDLGTHAIDLTRFLGGEVRSVQATGKTFVETRPEKKGSGKKVRVDVDDVMVSTLNFENGALGMLEASWLTPGRLDFLGFEAYGSKGSVRFNLERINELEIFLTEGNPRFNGPRSVLALGRDHPFMPRYWVNQGGGFAWEDSFVNELNHYIGCLADDKPISPQGATFVDGYRNCLIMDSMMESAKTGRRVTVAG